mgnify:CR=1 FL=1
MRIPGVVWTALIVLLTGALSGWLTDWFSGEAWAPLAVLILGLIAKAAEIYLTPTPVTGLRTPADERSKLARLLLG